MMDRKPQQHRFVLEEFFAGSLTGYGMTHTRFGKLANQFEIDAKGRWDSSTKTLSLTEHYRFDDGHQDELNWTITKKSNASYSGSETRLVGEAEGKQSRDWYRWRYTRRVPTSSGGETKLSFDDCFWLKDRSIVVARAAVSRFGFQVAAISVFYRKR